MAQLTEHFYSKFETSIQKLFDKRPPAFEISRSGTMSVHTPTGASCRFQLKLNRASIHLTVGSSERYHYNFKNHVLYLNDDKIEHSGLLSGFYLRVAKLLRESL